MNRDPIVEEIRQARQKILDECGGDLDRLMDRLKATETQGSGRVVSLNSVQRLRQERRPATKR